MFGRRSILLVGVLVTLNVALWVAGPGLALRPGIVQQLFGQKLVRAEVIEKGGADWRLDRGVITSVNSTQLTLREADGRIQPIPLSATTRVTRYGQHLAPSALARRWRVLVTWPANGAAQSVDVAATLRPGIVQQLLGQKLVRAEVIEKGGADWRLDRGVITSVNSTQLTLREADGRIQPIPLSATTRVTRYGQHLTPSALAPRWHVLVTWSATGAAQSVDVERTSTARSQQGLG